MLDLKIVGARIVDGTGNPWYLADVGIRNGRIESLGVVTAKARKRLDGRGLVLCPGFVDVHTHADGLLDRPAADNLLRQGITTVVSGNCGGSKLSVGDMLDRVDAARPSINYATLIGHGTVRGRVMGKADRKPTARELGAMRRLIDRAMRDGAAGISTGLFYVPGAYADVDELVELSKPVAAHGGIYVTHARSAGGKLPEAIEETAEISRRAGLPVHVSHLKALHRRGRTRASRASDILALIDRLRAAGVDISYDLHPYTATNTSLSSVALPAWVARDGLLNERLRDAAIRKTIRSEVKGRIAWIGGTDKMAIVDFSADRSLEGCTVADVARRRKRGDEDTAMDLVFEGNPRCVFHALRDADVRRFLTGELSMVASDAHVVQTGQRLVHPRNFGTFPRILRDYVRENALLSLEAAVRKMTSLPARRFRLAGRGQIAPGYVADLLLFDPGTIADHATFKNPIAYPTGLHGVLVNGVVAWRDGSDRIARGCGRAIRIG